MSMTSFPPRILRALFLFIIVWLPAMFMAPKVLAQTSSPAGTGTEDTAAIMQRRLARIIIPRLEFRATPLTDAIEQIRQESRRLDTDPDETTRGINIFLKLPSVSASSTGSMPTSMTPSSLSNIQAPNRVPITLTLVNASVLDALRLIAAQIGDKVKVEQYAVSIVPLSETTERLTTIEFSLPRQALGSSAETEGRVDAKSWLESQGIGFPPGSSAAYLQGPQKLIVRNTQDNLDRIKPLVASASAVIYH